MEPYKRIGNFLIFKERRDDILGKEFRAGWIEDEKIKNIISLVSVKDVFTKNEDLLKKFFEGMKELAILLDPKVVRTLGFGAIGAQVFISREYVRGETLGDILTTSITEKNFMPIDIVLFLFSQIASTLEYAHTFKLEDKRVFHGFLNPSDILVTYDGIVKVKNFMIYPILENYPYERNSVTKLYERYLTPDHRSGLPVTFSTDVYSFGMILFEFLTGTPFEFKEGESLRQKLDNSKLIFPYKDSSIFFPSLKNFLLKALSPNPEDRFSSPRELRRSFEAILTEENIDVSAFNLAFFMNSLYGIVAEKEEKEIENEASTAVIPVEVKEEVVVEREREEVPVRYPSIEFTSFKVKEKGSPLPYFIIAVILVAVIAVAGTLLIVGKKQAPQAPTISEVELQKKVDERLSALKQQMMEEFENRYKQREEEIKTEYEKLIQKASEEQRKSLEEQRRKELEALQKQRAEEEARAKAEMEAKIKAELEKKAETARKEEAPVKRKEKLEEEPQTPPEREVEKPKEVPSAQPSIEKPVTPYNIPSSQPKEGEIVGFTSLTKQPMVISQKIVNPEYPPAIKRLGIKGFVLVQILISEKGDVIDSKIIQEDPKGKGFGKAVVEAVKTWKFSPPEKDGVKVKTWKTLPFRFE
ncbi:MAG: TonB family protein [Candidatus Aminicenantia bacterium]